MAQQNSLSASVDVINQKTGDVVTQYANSSDRVVNLTETSIVRINASPEVVNYYEREGNDLIVHMKDGTTVRYQSFFELDADGLHSELIFQDDLGTHHAAFPYAADAGPAAAEPIVPAFSDVALGSLVGASGISALAVLGGIAAVGGIVGVAAAAGGGGGGGGGSSESGGSNGGGNNGGGNVGGGTETPPDTPTLRIASIASDNIINLAESTTAQLISGMTEAQHAGSAITITSNGQTWTTTVNTDGSWGVWLQPSELQSFPEGLHVMRFTITTSQGVTVNQNTSFTVNTTPPDLELTAFAPGDVVDQEQHSADKIVRGYVKAEDAGSTIFVTLNNKTYTAVADANGNWQLVIPQADMALLQDGLSYTINYRAIDLAGNVTEEQRTFTTNFSTPNITIDPVASDNIINSAEVLVNQTLSGQTVNIPAGQVVTITLGSKTYYAQVLGDGSWKAILPSGDLGALAQGSNTLTVSVDDGSGNTVIKSVPINVDTSIQGIAIAILSTDDYLNASEASQPLEVRGIATLNGTNATLIVTLNGKNYEVTNIDAFGNWSVTIPSEDLLALSDGPNVVTATIILGNDNAQDQHTLNVQIHHLPEPVMTAPFGDGYLNAAEKGQDQVLSGNTGVTSIGQKVTVQLGGKTYTATVDNDGNWEVTIPAGDLQNIPDGLLTVTVNASDASGNSAGTTQNVTVDTINPALTVLPLTTDGKLNGDELTQTQTLSGISSVSEQGQTVVVTLNGKTYTTVVGSDGNWQLSLPNQDLEALQTGNYPLTVTLTDAAGNSTTVSQSISVKTSPLTVTVQSLTDGNSLDAAEIKLDQILHGTSNAEAGSAVTVILGGLTYQGITDVLGNWQVTLPAVELQKLGDGNHNLSVSITDAYGQTQTVGASFDVDTTSDAVAISIISSDDYLNYDESLGGLTIQGNSAGLPAGTIVTVSLNGTNYTTAIQADGSWQTFINATAIAALTDGAHTVTATVITPNGTVIDSHNFTSIIHNLPSVSLDTAFGDGTINLSESGQSQTITGNTGQPGAGQTVVATLNGQQYTGVVNTDGSWSVILPQGAMESLTNGPGSITVVATDVAGNSNSSNLNFTVDKTPPALNVTPINGNDLLNGNNVINGVTLSGTTSTDTASVVVTINGNNYTATVNNGSWSLALGNGVLSALPNGISTYTVTATDSSGNTTFTVRTVTVDTTAPNVTMDPVTKDNVIDIAEQSTGFSLSGNTVPAEPGATVTVNLNGTTLTGTVSADGSWSIAVSPGVISGLASGTYTISVSVTDSAGNTSQTVTSTFTVDTTASAIAINPVESDDKISAADIADGLTISGSSARIPEGGTVTLTLNGVQYTTTVNASGFWQLTIPQAAAAAIADGTATLNVSAIDVDGKAVSGEHAFTIITHSLPQPTINAPFGDGVINAAEVLAGGNLSGNTGVSGTGQTVTVRLDNGSLLTATVDASGNWTLPLTPAQLGALSQGGHTVTVTATDAAGNQNVVTSPMTVDTLAPAVTIHSVTGDNIVNSAEAAGAITINGTGVYDAQHAQNIVVLVNGQNYDAILQANGTWSITLPAGALAGVPDGPVTVKVTITDYAGNSNTQTTSFTLDASVVNAPQVQINKVSGDDFVNRSEAQGSLFITGTTTNVEPGQSVTVTLNGKNYLSGVNADGSWSVEVLPGDLADVPDGSQVVTVTVTDLAGNPASSSHSVTFAAQPASQPTLSINTVAQDDVINALEHDRPLNITGASTHLAAGSVVTVLFNGNTYTASVDSSGNWSITVPRADVQALSDTPANAPYVISASASDAAQNPASATHNVTVDTSAPTLVVDVANSFLSDSRVNIAEAAVDQQISGTGTAGETVLLTINGKTIAAVVNGQGEWTMSISSSDLKALPQGSSQLTFSSTDEQGNTSSQSVGINVKTTGGPGITLNTMFGNNIVSISEAAAGTTLTGAASGLTNGTTVTVNINGQLFTGTVSGSTWSVPIGAGLLSTSGQFTVTVSAQDAWGNPATVNGNLDVVLQRPTAALTGPLFGDDNILSQAEANAGVQITGSSGQAGVGQTVKITLDNSQEFVGTVDVNGNWTVALTPAQLNAITDGTHTVKVTVTDRAGNSAVSADTSINVRTDPLPEPSLTQPFVDGVLNVAEAANPQTIGGELNMSASLVKSVLVSINNGPAVAATINADGTWSLDLSSTTLQALPDGVLQVIVTVTDIANNQVSGQGSFEVITHNLPVANYITPFGDGVINYSETLSDHLIQGNTGVTGSGQSVSVVLGTKTYIGSVDDSGNWTVTVPQTDLAALANNASLAFGVTVTDRAGNLATTDASTPNVTVHTSLPAPTVTNAFGDGILNITEAAGEATLTGSTGTTGVNQYVTVKIDVNGVTYNAAVNSSGNWSVTLPAGSLESLTAGQHQITIYAEDQYGNSAIGTSIYQVALTPPAVTITSPVFGDGYVSLAEVTAGTTLSGTFSTTYPTGTLVKVTIGDKTFNATVTGTQWSLAMDATDWSTVTARGLQNITVSVEDGAHNTNTASTTVTLLLDAPTVAVSTQFAGDNVLDYAESLTNQTLTGTSTHLQQGDTIRVTFTGGSVFSTTVQADGSWSLQLTPSQMATLQDGPITVQGIDKAGNVAGTTGNGGTLTLNLTPPSYSVNMDLVAGDNYVNGGEFVNGNLHLSGHAFNLNGTTLTILNGATPVGTATVNSDGSWSFDIPRASLQDGNYTFTVQSNSQSGVTASQTVVVDTVAPTLSVGAFAGDNLVNAPEKSSAQTISGLSDANGNQVTVTLNGKTYTAVVANGAWSVDVPQADMAALGNTSYTITATIRDPAGNLATATQNITVDGTAPLLQVDTLGVPAVLSTVNMASGIALQGQGEPGNTVTITLGPLSWSGTVNAQGTWSYTFPQLDLSILTDGPQVISISSKDAAGNVSTNSVSLNVALNKGLGVVIDTVFNDGILNVAESLVTQLVTGHVTGDYRGSKVSLTVVGTNFTINDLLVGADGSYAFQLPPSVWSGLLTNTVQLQVTVVDANGNTTYEPVDVGLALTNLPAISNVLVAGDNVINLAESGVDQLLSGTVSNVANVATMVVNFGGQAITVVPDALGRWTVNLASLVLGALPDGTATVGITITDKAGNVINTGASFNVVTHNLPGISLDTLFGDGTLSIAELANALLSGTATNLAGRTLTIQIGNATAFTTNVDNTGHWSVNLPDTVKSVLQGLGTGNQTVTITATDQYGNPASQTGTIKLNLVAPVLSNVVAFGDGLLNVADSLVNQTITGVVTNAPLGSSVQVTIGAKVFNGVVNASGVFSINLTPMDLASLADGTFTPSVKITTPDGNISTTAGSAVTIGLKNLPTITITSLFGNDGYLNNAEALAAQTISGTVSGLTSGVVTLNIGGTVRTANINSNGTWSLALSAGTLAGIADGSLTVTASVTDTVGNTVTNSQLVNAIVQAVPSIGLNTLFGNGTLDLVDLLTNPILSGTSSNLSVGTQIVVKVGALSFNTTIGANGLWQITVPALSLQGLQDGTNVLQVSARATDVAGNIATTSQNASVAIQATPAISITSLFGDGALNLADVGVAQTIVGTSQNATGSTLTVSVGGKSYTTTVGTDGNWSVTVPKTDLSALTDGSQSVSVAVTNAAGKVASVTGAVDVITHNLPTISLTSLFGNDGYLNISEAAGGQVIGGKIGGVVSGSTVVVTVGGTQINATVDASGNWTANVNSALLQNLANGTTTVGISVTDRVGNTTATSTDVQVKFTQPTLSMTPVTNLVGLLANVLLGLVGSVKLTISGSSTNLNQGAIVHLNLVNLATSTAVVGADGKWSTQLDVGLDLAKILSLSTIINLYAADTAGNVGYLNVGLNGSNPTTTPPVTTASLMAEATSFSILAASATEGTDAMTSDSTSTTIAHNTTAVTSETATESATTPDTAYTIGGVSIDLADGTQAGGDSVTGSTGSDTIHLSTLGFTDIDGGLGTDTLVLDGANMVLNLIDLAGKVHNIEIIDLGKSGTNSVTLDVDEALRLTDKPEDDLLIKGVTGDQINLKHGSSDTWAVTGQREVDGVQFDIYHNSSQTNTLSDVLIQHGLHVNMV
ncbi:Ig-like domain-containing protein [Kosakonia radicincitans]|uniref:Ig-like domain-containing protein n=1 Tax=Kosakonia radicincitans TaxID=283686 RepID=UPI0005C2F186|nr:Ig-like domain-containing protein [Kosakonia radicincitans]KIS42073.1 bacterial Ig-like domain family protein [Kosakonia radicincitans YD4]